MTYNFEYFEQPILEQDFADFESHYDLSLPSSYKTQILAYNGGVPVADYLTTETLKVTVSAFYSIKHGANTVENVIETLQVNQDVLPKYLFPFAHDMGGNDFCISLREEEYGKIYIWYHDVGGDMKFVADSFTEFMDALEEEPD